MLGPGSSISFQLEEDQGAVLMTRYPTYREDVQLRGKFKKYTKDHYDSWVAFARKNGHSKDVKPVLVTRVDVTGDFSMMTCPNNGCQRIFTFTTSGAREDPIWGTWDSKVPIYTNDGPHPPTQTVGPTPPPIQAVNPMLSPTQTADPTFPTSICHMDTAPDGYDQCVFVRYYTMHKRLGFPKFLKAATGPHDLGSGGYNDEGSPLEEESSFDSDSGIVPGLFDDERGGGSSETSVDSEPDTVIHNTTPVCPSPNLCAYFRSFRTTPYRTKGTTLI